MRSRYVRLQSFRLCGALALIASVGCHEVTGVVPDPALPGEDVSISGTGFRADQGTGEVRYDGEPLAVVSWSDTQIVATLPAAKTGGTYELTVEVARDVVSIPHMIDDAVAGMVHVPGGLFAMGTDAWSSSEGPIHWVELDGFHLDETEVTVVAYQACIDDGGCDAPSTGTYCNWGVPGRDDHPVNCVTWFQAVDFCAWEGKRLPTEAEWEKAARGTDQRTYPWGEEDPTCDRVERAGCLPGTSAVDSLLLGDSAHGAHNMGGNVAEWVADWWDSRYYEVSPTLDPQGPDTGTNRSFRGGSWSQPASWTRATERNSFPPSQATDFVGFRCALDE